MVMRMMCKDCLHNQVCLNRQFAESLIDIYGCDKYKSKADFVEVVRCKDCEHWNCVSGVTEHMGCDIFCDNHGREYPTNPDDFCSFGERKGGATE
jgi:ribosomal protein S27E